MTRPFPPPSQYFVNLSKIFNNCAIAQDLIFSYHTHLGTVYSYPHSMPLANHKIGGKIFTRHKKSGHLLSSRSTMAPNLPTSIHLYRLQLRRTGGRSAVQFWTNHDEQWCHCYWQSKTQQLLVMSPFEAEYMDIAATVQQTVAAKRLFANTGVMWLHPMTFKTDNQSAISLLKKQYSTRRRKLIDLQLNLIQ